MNRKLFSFACLLIATIAFADYTQLTLHRDYSTDPIPVSGYSVLVTSMPYAGNRVTVFNSSNQTLQLATGATGSEVVQTTISPGGGDYPFPASQGSKVSIKLKAGSQASVGALDINFY